MTIGGIIIMAASWTFIIGLSIYCMRKVIKLRDTEAEHIKTIFEIDTGDSNDSKKPEE
ncbi:hypothetical protein MNBD_NITROSPINAE02-837 [hydrothermal vent metagenome]|uniref:Uncharacterized protein n=1 Tax=hydrothermal vent metagenome TaxID=652676 RepID=A0A3B1D3H9_9ZZZZ